MKKFLLPAIFCAFGLSSFAQIANGNFENWTKVNLFEMPNIGITTSSSNFETYFMNGETNVVKKLSEGNSSMQISNIEIDGNVVPGYYIMGTEPNSEGQNLVFGNGFDINPDGITGLSVDMKMEIPQEKEGIVIVQFKNGGQPVGPGNMGPGTHVFPVSGTQDWTNMEFTFEESLDPNTNTCVIGFASADLVNDDVTFENGAYMQIDNIAWMGSEQEIPGGDMDSWLNLTPFYYPNECEVDADQMERTFFRTDDAFEGNWALGLKTIIRNGELELGSTIIGDVDTEGQILPISEIGSQQTNVSMMYKYEGAGSDIGEVTFHFFKADNEGSFNMVMEKSFDLVSNEEYTLVDYNFFEDLENNGLSADHIAVSITASKEGEGLTPTEGSTLIVDAVSLSGALGILSQAHTLTDASVRAYPNPTHHRVIFDFDGIKTGYMRVYSPDGISIATRSYAQKRQTYFDLSDLVSGTYVFKFYHTGGMQIARVVKL